MSLEPKHKRLARYLGQRGPGGRPLCCWCGVEVTGRRQSWCSDACVLDFKATYYRAPDWQIKRAIFERDRGVCAMCGEQSHSWEADHILEWAEGGRTNLQNLQTLCRTCHKSKSAGYAARRAYRRRPANSQLSLFTE